MQTKTDDVIKEAEVYAAYGRFSEAISILESAITRKPSSALRIKLAEIKQKAKEPFTTPRGIDGSTRPTSPIESIKNGGLAQERNRVDLGALRRQAEALTDSADRAQALAAITELERGEQELERLLVELEPRRLQERRERWLGLFVMLPIVIAATIFFISKLVMGQIPNIFVLDNPYISWNSDPYVFVFVVAFISIVLFAFACVAIGITRFGRDWPSALRRPNNRFEADAQKRHAAQPKR
ncbi:hypothetical protein SCL_1924 [Sulfuricaulis limicola]|uniref:Uncharacterized protein n=1 Tax=Sulfuricaulis limicola TaxID=1620215 RepID=A0A1B4XHE0_9GAMM|nr:hypothetical protein [Sulfuricaulis limicola]BAV34215.1 hypothetical protein SCL_1924 [Sulfuricaulis limicola]